MELNGTLSLFDLWGCDCRVQSFAFVFCFFFAGIKGVLLLLYIKHAFHPSLSLSLSLAGATARAELLDQRQTG
jgi:hypothetical protein